MLLSIITDLSLVFSVALSYLLCLGFIGVSKSFKEVVFPILIMSVITFISRVGFNVSSGIGSLISLSSCAVMVKVFNREISWMLSILGTFLTFIMVVFGGFMWPFLCFLFGVGISKAEPYTWNWIYLALGEIFLPFLVLILLKVKKISLMKYLAK